MNIINNENDVDVENMITNNYSSNSNTNNKDNNRNCNSPYHNNNNNNNNNRISTSSPSSSSSSFSPLPSPSRFSPLNLDRRNASIVNKKYAELNGYDNDNIINNNVKDNNDINDEEDGDFLILQRKNYKNRAYIHDNNSKRLPSPLHLKDDDNDINNNNIKNNSKSIYIEKKKIINEKRINAITQCMDRILNKKHIIIIKDYDFLVKTLYLVIGETVEFRLASDVPLHAEHQLQGESDIPSLRFESPLLIQEENTSYAFTPKCTGEINICCKIYSEMTCEVVVVESISDVREISKANNTISDSNYFKDEEEYYIYKNKEDIKASSMKLIAAFTKYCYNNNAEADVGLGCKVYFNGSINSESESFCDSDDFLSIYSEPKEDDNTYCLMSPARSVEFPSVSKINIDNNNDGTTNNQDYSHFKVYIEDFAFRPATITVPVFSKVDFITYGNASHKLNCDDEYEGVSLEGSGACYSHVFKKLGKYRVRDEIFSFMCCVIHVVPGVIEKEEKQEDEEVFSNMNYAKITIQDTTDSLIDTISSVCLNSLSNDSFDPDDDAEISHDDVEARRKAKKSKKKKAQRAKKRQEEHKILNNLAIIEQENIILDRQKADDMPIFSDSGDNNYDSKLIDIQPIDQYDNDNNNNFDDSTNHDIIDDEINTNNDEKLVAISDSTNHDEVNMSIEEKMEDKIQTNNSVTNDEIILENNNNVKNRRERKRRVRKSNSQKLATEMNNSSKIEEDTLIAIEIVADQDKNEKKIEVGIYALLQEKLNKSSSSKSNSNSPQSKPSFKMPPMHEVETYIASVESFFHDKWNEINFSGSFTDEHGIIFIKNEKDSDSDDDNGQKNRRRRQRYRRHSNKNTNSKI
jgi:plastocyanin